DEFGRVKVQFHWDREGQYNENSSCWLRVSQVHAGKGWGMMDLPRIGEEVIVSFLEGDPDRPLIVGRVYNGINNVPFSLPAEKTRRGNSTKTYKGAGYNEMSMDDTPGKEQLRMNAQYNMNSNVNNDQTLDVGNNQTEKVGVDRTREVGSNEAVSIGANQQIEIGASQQVVVGASQSVQIGTDQSVTAGNRIVINAGTSITLKCGASTIHMNQAGVITIAGTIVTTAAAINANVAAPITNVNGSLLLSQTGLINTSVGVIKYDEGSMLGHYGGGKAELAASGECLVQGAPVKLN
ncbi:MAG: type VI secretion system tip protein VgrG, partial [Planctomycetaceae bacterium]|nr:type VI secretion system tip protein VgrG [Planctomycetaceae bacterium]